MLLAEELVLLALDPDGSLARTGTQTYVEVGVTGALVTELVQRSNLNIVDGRIGVLDGPPPANSLLAQALEHTAPHEGKRLRSRLARIKHAGWKEVVDAMVEEGMLSREKHPLRPTRHPVTDPAQHARLLAELRSAASGDDHLDARPATLLALAGPCHLLEVLAPERSDRERVKARIAEAAEQVPAAAAVKYVIQAMEAATAAAVTAAASAGASGGG